MPDDIAYYFIHPLEGLHLSSPILWLMGRYPDDTNPSVDGINTSNNEIRSRRYRASGASGHVYRNYTDQTQLILFRFMQLLRRIRNII